MLQSFFPNGPPPPAAAPASDPSLVQRIHKLVEYASRNGPAFVEQVRTKQHNNPEYAFLQGGYGAPYFHWALFSQLSGRPLPPLASTPAQQPLPQQPGLPPHIPPPSVAGNYQYQQAPTATPWPQNQQQPYPPSYHPPAAPFMQQQPHPHMPPPPNANLPYHPPPPQQPYPIAPPPLPQYHHPQQQQIQVAPPPLDTSQQQQQEQPPEKGFDPMSFPPGLIPTLVSEKLKASGNHPYTPLAAEEIEKCGLPPPPTMDDYLKARVDKLYAQLDDYRPGQLFSDIEIDSGRQQQFADRPAPGPLAPASGKLDDGSVQQGAASRGGGGGRARGLGYGSRQSEGGEEGGLEDAFSAYRHSRSAGYHAFVSKLGAGKIWRD